MKHVHPVFILKRLWRFWFIILLPFFQLLFSGALDFTPANTLPTVFLCLAVFWEWYGFRYELGPERLIVTKGILIRRRKEISRAHISTMDIDAGLFLGLFHSVEVRIDTESGSGKRPDVRMPVWKKDGQRLLLRLCGGMPGWQYRSPAWKTGVGALAFSRSAPGLLLLAPIIKTGGQLLGKGFEDRVYGTVSTAQQILGRYIPPFFAAVAYLVAAGWLVSFLFLSLRQMNFHLGRAGNYLVTRKGLLARRYTVIAIPMVTAQISRQTPLMRCLGMTQLLIDSAGYGKEQGELAILIPAEPAAAARRICASVLPELRETPITIHPPASSRMRYLSPALGWGVTFLAAELLLLWLLPAYAGLSGLLLALPACYCLLFALMRLRAHREAGVSWNFLTCAGYRGLIYYRAVFPKKARLGIMAEQNPAQQWAGLCHVRLVPRSESRFHAKIKHLSAQDFPLFFPRPLPPPLKMPAHYLALQRRGKS